MAVSLHYCAGELSGVDLSLKEVQKNCICGKPESKTCCNDKVIIFKAPDSHHSSVLPKLNFTNLYSAILVDLPVYVMPSLNLDSQLSTKEYKNPPPFKAPIYILNRVFII